MQFYYQIIWHYLQILSVCWIVRLSARICNSTYRVELLHVTKRGSEVSLEIFVFGLRVAGFVDLQVWCVAVL